MDSELKPSTVMLCVSDETKNLGEIGLEESTFTNFGWTARAWFGSLEMQWGAHLILFIFNEAHLHMGGVHSESSGGGC